MLKRAYHISRIVNEFLSLRIGSSLAHGRTAEIFSGSSYDSGYKGVSLRKSTGRYEARITAYGEKYHLGFFDTIEEAIIARKDAEERLHGEYARVS